VGWRAQLLGWKPIIFRPQSPITTGRAPDNPQATDKLGEWIPFLPDVSLTKKPAAIQRHIIKNRYLTLIKNASWRDIISGFPAILKFELLLIGAM